MADNDQEQTGGVQAAPNTETRFGLQRIYVKDSSFEAPESPECFRNPYNPKVDISINTQSRKVDDENNIYEVVLKLTTNLKQDDKTLCLVEVQQAGLFEIKGFAEGEHISQVVNITCPTILFPYAREAIDTLVIKGSFPALMLSPINFEAIYMQAQKQRAEQQAEQAPTLTEEVAAPAETKADSTDSGSSESH